eukprot:scaffold2983_cov123-Cylindrotheca_fusiformis.AAC.4
MIYRLLQFLLSLLTLASRITCPSAYSVRPRHCRRSPSLRIQEALNDKSYDSSSPTALNDKSHDNSSPSCPFSKSFPRYKIDLTRSREASPVSSSWFGSPFRSFFQLAAKSKLKKLLEPEGPLYWADNLDGVAAITMLWDRAATLLRSETSRSGVEVVALPDASQQLVQNWVEIVQWMGDGDDCLVKAELIAGESANHAVPAVRIQRVERDIDDLETISPNDSVEVLNARTQAWVKRILVEQGICPFTKSVRKSGQGLSDVGVPVGSISYHGSFATNAVQLFADTWKAIEEMMEAGPSGKDGISSILLAAPGFDDDFDFWAGPIFTMLESSVVAAQAQDRIGVVCFHPEYATPDGKSWPGFGHMHSVPRLEKWYQEHSETKELVTEEIAAGGAWQRRTPHATINVLRADQLEAAESKRMTGSMYTENIEKLVCTIGSKKLAEDLELERKLGSSIS